MGVDGPHRQAEPGGDLGAPQSRGSQLRDLSLPRREAVGGSAEVQRRSRGPAEACDQLGGPLSGSGGAAAIPAVLQQRCETHCSLRGEQQARPFVRTLRRPTGTGPRRPRHPLGHAPPSRGRTSPSTISRELLESLDGAAGRPKRTRSCTTTASNTRMPSSADDLRDRRRASSTAARSVTTGRQEPGARALPGTPRGRDRAVAGGVRLIERRARRVDLAEQEVGLRDPRPAPRPMPSADPPRGIRSWDALKWARAAFPSPMSRAFSPAARWNQNSARTRPIAQPR